MKNLKNLSRLILTSVCVCSIFTFNSCSENMPEPIDETTTEVAKLKSTTPFIYPGWTQVWVDNFSSSGSHTSQWRTGYPWGSKTHNHKGFAVSENEQWESDALKLIAGGGKTGKKYNTGVVSAKYQIKFPTGNEQYVIEARMKLANRNGIWPAFWLNSTGKWPNINEIDIMEQKGWGSQKKYETNMHFGVSSGNRPTQHITKTGPNNLDNNWHRYGVAIKKNEVKILFDGQVVNRITNSSRVKKLRSKTYNIIINSAVGGAWGGNGYTSWIDDYTQTSRYLIDYVVVMQK